MDECDPPLDARKIEKDLDSSPKEPKWKQNRNLCLSWFQDSVVCIIVQLFFELLDFVSRAYFYFTISRWEWSYSWYLCLAWHVSSFYSRDLLLCSSKGAFKEAKENSFWRRETGACLPCISGEYSYRYSGKGYVVSWSRVLTMIRAFSGMKTLFSCKTWQLFLKVQKQRLRYPVA